MNYELQNFLSKDHSSDPAGHFTAWLGRPLSRLEATVIRQLEYLRYRHLPVKLLINDPDPSSNRIPLLLVSYFRYLSEHLHRPSFPLVVDRTKPHAQLLTRRLRGAKLYSSHRPDSLRGANANHLLILNAHTYPKARIPASLHSSLTTLHFYLRQHGALPYYKKLFDSAYPLLYDSPNSILVIHGTAADPRNYFTQQFRHHTAEDTPLLTLDLTPETPSPVALTFDIPLTIYLPDSGASPPNAPPGGPPGPPKIKWRVIKPLSTAGATAALNEAA